ncbi:MAG: phosphomethylpyrimidine synthase ThiC, partial [Polaromonas sp.]|nr:phosphomethylpyrimidine synthase ThiC [Polaromonas sp.]
MNAPDKFSQLLALTREPFPASRKIYVAGQVHPDLRVPMREVSLSNGESATLYDTSGPYTDPAADIDVRRGLEALRAPWIEARGDTEIYTGRTAQAVDDGTRREDRTDPSDPEAQRIAALRAQAAGLQRTPRRAKAGANVSQMHYARRGIITPEM